MGLIATGIFELKDIHTKNEGFLKREFGWKKEIWEEQINDLLSDLNGDLWAFWEYPYVDKVYRSSYYAYFATKHRPQVRDTIRISLFAQPINSRMWLDGEQHKYLQNIYRGFFTIRPTPPYVIGRTMISPRAKRVRGIDVCYIKEESNIHGVNLEVNAFPYCMQDGETMTCAQTAIWMIMEYLGHKYPEFTPLLPEDIIRMIEHRDYKRTIPSEGIAVETISSILKECCVGTTLYTRREIGSPDLANILSSYIASHIPVVIALEDKREGSHHAIVACGNIRAASRKTPTSREWRRKAIQGKSFQIMETSNLQQSFVAMDDNLPPYQIVNMNSPSKRNKRYKIEAIIVPLQKKLYLDAKMARDMAVLILNQYWNKSGWKERKLVMRLFCEKSGFYKSFIAGNTELGDDIKGNILKTSMPRNIWVAEISTSTSYFNSTPKVSGLIILDATEADDTPMDGCLFFATPSLCRTGLDQPVSSSLALPPFSEYTRPVEMEETCQHGPV